MHYLHTMVRVSDLEKALDFYCRILGLEEFFAHTKESVMRITGIRDFERAKIVLNDLGGVPVEIRASYSGDEFRIVATVNRESQFETEVKKAISISPLEECAIEKLFK